MKKRVYTELIFLILAGRLFAGPIDVLNRLTPEESISYTLEKTNGKVIAVGKISGSGKRAMFYGRKGQLLDYEEYKDSVFEIGSLTKTFTAALICRARKEGLLNIEDSISKYLDLENDEKKSYPSIKKILTHTSGYDGYYLTREMAGNHLNKRNDFNGITREQILKQVKKVNLKSDKDYDFKYSNFGYAVLGLVLESVYKKSYTDLVNEFAKELGLNHTHIADGTGNLGDLWDWQKDDGYLSAGALYSTLDDMLLYAKLQLNEEGIFADCHEIFTEINKKTSQYEKMGIYTDAIGYAWILDEKNNVLWHNGATGSYNCYLGFKVSENKAVVVLTNLEPDYRIPATVLGTKLMDERGTKNE